MQGSRAITNEEINELLKVASPRDRLLILTGITFGTRISESLELTFKDVDGATLRLKSKKGSFNQEFPIPRGYNIAMNAMKKYYQENGIEVTPDTHLFLSVRSETYRGKVMTSQNANSTIRLLAKRIKAEGKVSCHSMRKAFVTRIYEKTEFNIAATQKYSRHKSLNNLQYYISTTDSMELVNDELWG